MENKEWENICATSKTKSPEQNKLHGHFFNIFSVALSRYSPTAYC